MSASVDAVLLIAFGGPEKPEDVRPFLTQVTRGRPIPPARLDEVARHYAEIGGRSPLNAWTYRQADALRARLRTIGLPWPVYVGMRNWTPYLHETLAAMAADGVGHALGIILSAHQSEASWERYQVNVADACARVGPAAPTVRYAPEWHAEAGFVEAMAERVAAARATLPPSARDAAPVVFTAHSLPVAMAETAPYAGQVAESSRLVASRLGLPQWSVAYQSRSGRPGEPWLEPDVGDEVRRLAAVGARHVVVAPIGFVCDHVEVLYDLDVETRALAARLGIGFVRAGTVADHPAFIDMLAGRVRTAALDVRHAAGRGAPAPGGGF